MAEKETAILVPVKVEYECDACKQGYMEQHGSIMLMSNPPLIPHRCRHCGATQNLPDKYPTVRFKANSP